MSTLIMKFGGASVATPSHILRVAQIISDRRRLYKNIVVVVSAMGHTTNDLIALAHQIHDQPPQREFDMLMSAGERISISLLAMALDRFHVDAVSFTGSQSGIITSNSHSNATILDVRPIRILEALSQNKIVIVAGFQGVSLTKEVTTLGRGGSDLTAVALGVALKADVVEYLKDVPGIFSKDPKSNPDAVHFQTLSYTEALGIVANAKVLHPRAVRLAQKYALPLHILSYMDSYHSHPGTKIFSMTGLNSNQAVCGYE